MADNPASSSIRFITKDILLDVLLFPFWWYTSGAIRMGRWFRDWERRGIASRGLRIWFRNFFKPMYGDFTLEGRLISFGMRLVVSFWKIISFAVSTLVAVLLVGLYLVAPLLGTWYLLYQLIGVPFFGK